MSSIGVWACIGAETSAHRNILIELTSKSGNKQRPKIVTEINEIPRALVKSPMKPPERKQPNPILNPRNPKQADKLRINQSFHLTTMFLIKTSQPPSDSTAPSLPSTSTSPPYSP